MNTDTFPWIWEVVGVKNFRYPDRFTVDKGREGWDALDGKFRNETLTAFNGSFTEKGKGRRYS